MNYLKGQVIKMSEEELKKTIDIVASIEVNNETEAIAKEELMSYAEQLQNEHNILTEFEKWLEEKIKTVGEKYKDNDFADGYLKALQLSTYELQELKKEGNK